ncbi:hypothetical protein EMCRGX_G022087 [Ephydatia muelleri]
MLYNAIVVIPLVGHAAKRFHLAVVHPGVGSRAVLFVQFQVRCTEEQSEINCSICQLKCENHFAVPEFRLRKASTW